MVEGREFVVYDFFWFWKRVLLIWVYLGCLYIGFYVDTGLNSGSRSLLVVYRFFLGEEGGRSRGEVVFCVVLGSRFSRNFL